MTKVLFNDIMTEHESTLGVARRLAACCTFFFAQQRERARLERRSFDDRHVPVLLVWHPEAQMFRLAEPGAGIVVVEHLIPYTIDGMGNEARAQRTILGLIAPHLPLVNRNPMPTKLGVHITENMGAYRVLEIAGRRMRVVSAVSGWELWIDWDDSNYLDESNQWRCL